MTIGDSIKKLRTQRNLTQQELANRCELSKGFISQIESNITSPSISTLVDILECLGVTLQSFFSEKAPEKLVFTSEDMFEKEYEEIGSKIKWLIPNSQKNEMEPILITIESKGSSVQDNPHPGEEFGYVVSGTIYLYVGEEKYRVKKGEAFYIKANSPHRLYNAGKDSARVIWVSTPPSF